jgi:hypothetical protein
MKFLLINKIILQISMYVGITWAINAHSPHLALAYLIFLVGSFGNEFFNSQIRGLQAIELQEKLQELNRVIKEAKEEYKNEKK